MISRFQRLLVLCLVFLFLTGTSNVLGSVSNLETMVRKNPEDVRLQFLLGKAYSQKGDHLKAKSIFQKILQKKKAPIVFMHLGLEFAAMGNLTGAILQWTSVIEQKPNNVSAMKFLARALHKHALSLNDPSDQEDLFEQSLGWWKRILHLDPGNLRARYYAGIESYKLKRYEAAAKHWLILLRQKNTNLKVLKCLAKALIKAGQIDKAKRVALKVVRLESKKRRKSYTPWAKSLLRKIKNGDIQKPDIRENETQLTRGEEKPHTEKKWKNPDPDDFLKPVKPRRREPAPPPSVGPDPKFTIQAETLFLDGLDFKDNGQYEKALFSFLQAIDINPDFTQVFLQMGEVYIQLAKLAKRTSQFKERLSLSRQALEKVREKSPGSLIAHAAKSKIVILDKLKRYGFKGYHLKTAHKAIKEKREDDAFDEYILLLSNQILEPGIFLETGAIVKALSISNKQDLLFFTEDLYKKHQDKPWITYLLGKLYEATDDLSKAEKAYSIFTENFDPKGDKDVFALYIKFIDHPQVSPVDSFLGAKLLLKVGETNAAKKLLKRYLKNSDSGSLFAKEAHMIEQQLTRTAATKSAGQKSFKAQRNEIVASVQGSKVLFDNGHLSKSVLDKELLNKFDVFINSSPDNYLAVFIKAWILDAQSYTGPPSESDEKRKKSEELFYSLLTDSTSDPYWHFTMGIQALRWELKDRGMDHLKHVGDLLLSSSVLNSNEFANMLIIEAEHFEVNGYEDMVISLLRQARVYSSESLNYYLTRAWIEYRRGNVVGAAGHLFEWVSASLTRPWIRRLVLCDMGLILFLAVMITILTTATVLVLKYFEKLHHFFAEFIAVKGMAVTIGLGAMAAIFIVSFSSGLIVFLPVLLWPLMSGGEKASYVTLVVLLLVIPLLLPVSFFDNFELIRQIEALKSGNSPETAEFFAKEVKENPDDFSLLYAHGTLSLRSGEFKEAQKVFSRLSKMTSTEGPVINLGIIEARQGNYEKALNIFQNALSIEAKSVPALFNLYSICNFQGNKDKAEQYLRWAKQLATTEHQLERYLTIPTAVNKLPLMDQPPDTEIFDSNFSFFNSKNFFRLNANFLGFITWFLMGGGLIGILLFVREQIDIISSHCSHCYVSTCNLCHHVVGTSVLCEDCAEKEDTLHLGPEKQLKSEKAREKVDLAKKKATVAGIILPGTELLFIDSPVMSTICQLAFWTFLQAATGGWLLPFIFPDGPGTDTLAVFTTLLWAGTLTSYLLPAVLTYKQKENIEWM